MDSLLIESYPTSPTHQYKKKEQKLISLQETQESARKSTPRRLQSDNSSIGTNSDLDDFCPLPTHISPSASPSTKDPEMRASLFKKKLERNEGIAALLDACQYNNLRGVRYLVKKRGISPLSANSQGNTALFAAVNANNAQIVNYLLEAAKGQELRLNRPFTHKRWTLLTYAAINKSTEIVKLLLRNKASPNALDAEMRTPLFYSVMKKDVDSVRLFLRYRASLDHIDTNGKSLLDYAFDNYDLDIVRMLVRHGVTLGKDGAKGKELLLSATMANDALLIKHLVERDVPLTAQDPSVGRSNDCSQDKKGQTLLMRAVNMESEDAVKALLQRGEVDLNKQDFMRRTAVMRAAAQGCEKILELLLKEKPNLELQDQNGHNALALAVRGSHLRAVEALLASKQTGTLFQLDAREMSPLDLATDERVLQLLKEQKAQLLVSKEDEEMKQEAPKYKRKTRIEIKMPPATAKSTAVRTEEKREGYLSKQSLHRVAASIQQKALLEKEAKTNVYLQKRKLLKNKSAYEKLQAEPVFGRLNQNLATPRKVEEDEEFIMRLMQGEKSKMKRRVSVQIESKILRTLISPINQVVLHKEQRGWPEIKTPRSKNAFFSKLYKEKSKIQNNKMGDFLDHIDQETERERRNTRGDFFNIRVENQKGSERRFQVERPEIRNVILNVGEQSEKFLFAADPTQGEEKPSPLSGFTNRKSSIAEIMKNYFS